MTRVAHGKATAPHDYGVVDVIRPGHPCRRLKLRVLPTSLPALTVAHEGCTRHVDTDLETNMNGIRQLG